MLAEKLDGMIVKIQQNIKRGKKLEDYWTDIPALCRAEKEKVGYATQKPLKLMKRIISMFSNVGQQIYDPFCGSGSFLVAGEELGRITYGADISNIAFEKTASRLKQKETK